MNFRSCPDAKDYVILKLIRGHKSMRTIATETKLSVAGVYVRLQHLVEKEYLTPPRIKGEAKAYELAVKGAMLLERMGM